MNVKGKFQKEGKSFFLKDLTKNCTINFQDIHEIKDPVATMHLSSR